MKTIDHLLADLVKTGVGKLDSSIPIRDKKILISLHKQIQCGNFLTKNQGDLLIKILKENYQSTEAIVGDHISLLENPLWGQSFRVIQPVKKIYRNKDNLTSFVVEFTWNKRLQQTMSELSKNLQGSLGTYSNKAFNIMLTEKNIYLVVNKLKPMKFEISEEINKYYQEICSIIDNPKDVKEVNLLENEKIFNSLYNEIGGINEKKNMLLVDRQIRYQYAFFNENNDYSLTNKLASRKNNKVWIKNSIYTLSELFESLQELKRFPCLIILSGHESVESLEKLTSIAQFADPSVYFRFDNNSDNNVKFNTFVTENNFNKRLTKDTKMVVLANNKLPKFMFNSGWYPKSVISFTNNFRTNKTSVWCDAVDLQIYYTEKTPMIGGADALV